MGPQTARSPCGVVPRWMVVTLEFSSICSNYVLNIGEALPNQRCVGCQSKTYAKIMWCWEHSILHVEALNVQDTECLVRFHCWKNHVELNK
jgi:hypothetical protein